MKNKLLFTGIIIVAGLLLLSGNAFAAQYYVDINNPSSNDNGPGTQAQPWKTINKAIHTLNAGDTAYISPGSYNIAQGPFAQPTYINGLDPLTLPAVTPANSGTQAQPIKLIALSTAAQIIGKGNMPGAQDDAHQVFVTHGVVFIDSGKNYWQVQGFYPRLA